jgi:hypothetical protein
MNFFKKLKEQYDSITWKKVTDDYCKSLKGVKMGLSDRVPPSQDDPPSKSPKR